MDWNKELPYSAPKNRRGHVWKKEEDGDIDIFGMSAGHHNGPVCVKCGYGFCHHCHELPQMDCPKATKRKAKKKKTKRK